MFHRMSVVCQRSDSTSDDGSGNDAGMTAKVDKQDDSSTKVNWGDKICIFDLCVPNAAIDQAEPRPVCVASFPV